MTTLSDAADALIQWAERNKAILDAADALKSIGSLEQAHAEATALHAAAVSKLDEANAQLTVAQQQLVDTHTAISTAAADASSKAAGIIGAAHREAEDIIQRAQADAADLRTVAQRDAQAASDAANGELDLITGKIGDARVELEAKIAANADADKVKEEIEAKVEALKKAAQSVLA